MASRIWTVGAVLRHSARLSMVRTQQRVQVAATRVAQAVSAQWPAAEQDGLRLGFEEAACGSGAATPERLSVGEALERAGDVLRQNVWLAVPKKKVRAADAGRGDGCDCSCCAAWRRELCAAPGLPCVAVVCAVPSSFATIAPMKGRGARDVVPWPCCVGVCGLLWVRVTHPRACVCLCGLPLPAAEIVLQDPPTGERSEQAHQEHLPLLPVHEVRQGLAETAAPPVPV